MRAQVGLPLSMETTVVKNDFVQMACLTLEIQQNQRFQGLGKQENKINYMSIKKESKACMCVSATRIYARIGFFSHLFSTRIGAPEMRESHIEKALVHAVKKRGGLALKLVSPGMSGVPDRLLLFASGKLSFVEVKAPSEKLRPLQMKRKRQLEALGFSVYCLDDIRAIGGMLDEICAT